MLARDDGPSRALEVQKVYLSLPVEVKKGAIVAPN